ncbi:TM2 domain-containing protein [Tistrella bauzanensis]|uniref:TM2 domain-containing protein n=1 Tax=Tistrella arctica TaxID=3133430 RepID=A0ABU9YG71_9PROT
MSRDEDFLGDRPRGASGDGAWSGQDRSAMMMRYDNEKKSLLIAYLLWFFLGVFGVHRMYLGAWVSGLLMLALNGVSTLLAVVFIGYIGFILLFLWLLLDLFLIPVIVRRRNEELIRRLTT